MTGQAKRRRFVNGPPAGLRIALACGLPVAVILFSSTAAGKGQEPPGQPATTEAPPAAKARAEKKTPAEPAEKKAGHYLVHQSLELGGRITSIQGSQGMWNTLVDMGSGGRILSQSLEMRSESPAKTPFFDTLTTSSFGYGGDPNDVTFLNASKGRIYNFAGSFRRDRQYFDYNLLANSLNTNPAGLVPENDSPHLFNTVRRNTDAQLTLLPLSRVNIRAGFNYNVGEGPSYSSIHEGADALLFQMWSNANETYSGGVDVKLAPRTSLSYDQFFVHYKGNTSWELAGLNAALPNGAPVSYGLDPGSGPCPGVRNGVGLPSCNGYLGMSIFQPIRTSFPTEQLRFSTRYWSRVSMNARILYNSGKTTVPHFNEFYNGLTTRTNTRQEIDTGAGPGGQFSTTKRDDVNADYGLVAEISKYLTFSDAFSYWAFRLPGSNDFTSTVWAGAQGIKATLLTPISSLTPAISTGANLTYLNQKIGQNTALAIFTVLPGLKLSGGYRFKTRNIADYGPDNLTWHENWALLGAVIQPDPIFRVNVDYEHMDSASADSATTPSNTYTRLMPDNVNHIRIRGTAKPARWFSVAADVNDYQGKNDDPLVNHTEHNRDLSFTASVSPMETLSLDIDVAHDDVASQTDICYEASKPPTGATNSGTCTVAASGAGIGDPSYLLGNGYYHAPATFVAGSIHYAPTRLLRLNAGARLNDVSGQNEILNPNEVPGALFSKYATPFVDAQFDIARGWTWHGNWTRDDYSEQGPFGIVVPRNVHGDIVTLGVKYAF
jgi:hypothetical protein